MELKHFNETNSVKEIAENMSEEMENVRFLLNRIDDLGDDPTANAAKKMLKEQIKNLKNEIDILKTK